MAWKSSHACKEAKLTKWIGECGWDKEIDYSLSKIEKTLNHFCIMLKTILGCSQSNFTDKKVVKTDVRLNWLVNLKKLINSLKSLE